MKKLNYVYLCYGASFAIVLAIAVFPFSSWSFRNHLDVLSGGWKSDSTFLDNITVEQIQPIRLTRGYTVGGVPTWHTGQGYPFEDSMNAYVKNAHAHPNDPASLAHLVRLNFRAPHRAPDPNFRPPSPSWKGYTIGQVRTEAMWAAEQGGKVDPENAFFPLFQAVLLDWEGRRAKANQALSRAGMATRFVEYSEREASDRTDAMKHRYGYRGERARTIYMSSILMPHYATLKLYAKDLAARPLTKENIQAQADFLRAMETMQRTDPFTIGVLVSVATQVIILRRPPVSFIARGPFESPQLVDDLDKLAKEFHNVQDRVGVTNPYDASDLARTIPRLRGAARDLNEGGLMPMMPHFSWQAVAPPPIFLFAVIASLLFAVCVSRMKTRSETVRRMTPYIGSIAFLWAMHETVLSNTVQFLSPVFYWGVPLPDPGELAAWFTLTMSILGLAQIWAKLQKFATVLAILNCAVCFFWSYPALYAYLPSVAFFLLLGLMKLRGRMPMAIAGFLTFAAIGALSVAFTTLAFRGPAHILAVSMMGAAGFVTLLFFANGSRRLLPVMPVITFFFAVGYLGGVIREIRENQEVKASLDGWMNEADVLRAKANILPG